MNTKAGTGSTNGRVRQPLTACGRESMEVIDTGPGFNLTAVPAGHGLDNLVERLDALFGAKARLNVFRRDGHSVTVLSTDPPFGPTASSV